MFMSSRISCLVIDGNKTDYPTFTTFLLKD